MSDDNEERWQLAFVLPPSHVVGGLLTATPPDVLVRTNNGVPDDARFVRMFVDDHTQNLWVVLEHPSFKARYAADGLGWFDGMPVLCGAAPTAIAYCGAAVRAAITGETVDGGKDADSFKHLPGGHRA